MAKHELKLTLNGKEVDLAKSWPLTIGDMKAFKKLGLVTKKGDIDTEDIEDFEKMIGHLCRKVNPEINGADVEQITVPEMGKISDWIEAVTKESGLDRPTSTPSASSRKRGAGGRRKSKRSP